MHLENKNIFVKREWGFKNDIRCNRCCCEQHPIVLYVIKSCPWHCPELLCVYRSTGFWKGLSWNIEITLIQSIEGPEVNRNLKQIFKRQIFVWFQGIWFVKKSLLNKLRHDLVWSNLEGRRSVSLRRISYGGLLGTLLFIWEIICAYLTIQVPLNESN